MKNLLFRCDPCARTVMRSVADDAEDHAETCEKCDNIMYVQSFGEQPRDRREEIKKDDVTSKPSFTDKIKSLFGVEPKTESV